MLNEMSKIPAQSGKSSFVGKINKEWHLKNKMPKNPTLEERIKWHIEHAKNCTCREMPDSIRKEIENLPAGKAGRKKKS